MPIRWYLLATVGFLGCNAVFGLDARTLGSPSDGGNASPTEGSVGANASDALPSGTGSSSGSSRAGSGSPSGASGASSTGSPSTGGSGAGTGGGSGSSSGAVSGGDGGSSVGDEGGPDGAHPMPDAQAGSRDATVVTCPSPSCTLGQMSCVSGQLATCTEDANHCRVFGTPTPCGMRQVCTAGVCTCNTDPNCTAPGTYCSTTTVLLTCTQDSQGCLYGSSAGCPNGACNGSAGTASCCANTCAAGVTQCSSGVPQLCTLQTNGCTAWISAAACTGGKTCQTGGCACPAGTVDCGGSCVNTASDGSNCNACGHNCQGGACTGGVCQPLTLAPSAASGCAVPSHPYAITVDAARVYWTEGTKVMSAPLNGGPCVTLASGIDVGEPVAIATDSANVYYSNYTGNSSSGWVMRVAAAGGSAPVQFAKYNSNYSNPWGIAVVAGNVYWADNGEAAAYKAPALTGTLSFICGSAVNCWGSNPPFNIAADSVNIYVAGLGGPLYQMPQSGAGPVLTLQAPGSAGVSVVAVDSRNVYWTTGGLTALNPVENPPTAANLSILTTPIGGGTVGTVVSGTATAALAVDASGIYWDNGSVMRTPPAGNPVTLASGQNATFMAVDSTSVYWTNAVAGTVMKVAK